MYPVLTPPLLVGLGVAAGVVVFLLARRPVLRRLALRQVVRRPTEAMLVVLGSVLGAALIMASLVVGDSLDRSVRQTAYDTLGPIDETVTSATQPQGRLVDARLRPLRHDPQVDGLLTVVGDRAAAVHDAAGNRKADPLVLAWEVDFADAARFGAPSSSGLKVRDPGPGGVVINENLATRLRAGPGDRLTFYLFGTPRQATIREVVPAQGLAGMGVGAAVNSDAFFSPGSISSAAKKAGRAVPTTTLISNAGGVEEGARLTRAVTASVVQRLGPLRAEGATVATPKKEVLDAAKQTGDILGSLFLFIGSFSIIAGVLLLVNVFVMLADERKGQLGMLRAIGLRRRRVTAAFAIEGAVYAAIATVIGAALGIGLGRIVVVIALRILNSSNTGTNRLNVSFHMTTTSVVNGLAAGFLIAFAAVVLTSVRIARTNIIAAIRDLDPQARPHPRKRLIVASAVLTAVFVAASVPAVVNSAGAAAYLLPALAAVCALPLLARVMPAGVALTAVALGVMTWGVTANLVRPHIYDDASSTTYVVLGCMLSFAAVTLVSQHQSLLLSPLRPLVDRPTQNGLATRLAVSYPTAKRFRTGATLAMYSVVVLVIVLLTEISSVVQSGVDAAVADATGGWTQRVDYNPSTPLRQPAKAMTTGPLAGRVDAVAPLLAAPATGTDPRHPGQKPLAIVGVGVPPQLAQHGPKIDKHLRSLPSSAATWRLVTRDPRYVLVDGIYGATGGPQPAPVTPGSKLTLVDPRTGRHTTRTVAGVVNDGTAFYRIGGGEFRYPVFMSRTSARAAFGSGATRSSLLLRAAPGQNAGKLMADLQGQFLTHGLVAYDVRQMVRDSFASSQQFFLLMRGYLALGLLVGITSLGVIMVRAVRERRRTIGVLRALGFRSRTVRRAFMAESTFVAVEGVVIGTVLGVITTYVLYSNSPAFGNISGPFPIAWRDIGLTVGVTLLASVLATAGPAHRAAGIRPATAVRVAD